MKSCTGPHDSRAAGRLGNNSGHAEKTVSKGHGYNEVPLGADREHARCRIFLGGGTRYVQRTFKLWAQMYL